MNSKIGDNDTYAKPEQFKAWNPHDGKAEPSPHTHAVEPGHTNTVNVITNAEASEMAQRLKAGTALPEVLSPIPSIHMVVPNHLQLKLRQEEEGCPVISSLLQALHTCGAHTHIHTK